MVDVPSHHHRLLLVEDDPEIRSQLLDFLVSEGFEVEVANDGEQALRTLRAAGSIDLILLDLMLPKKDGWEFRVAQRSDPILATIPVVVTSANTSAQARAIDADAYVPKPFEPEAIVAAIRWVLDQRRNQHADRLASLGRMAAGIAHEVNNPLTYVHASLMLGQNILSSVSKGTDPRSKAPLSSAGAAFDKAVHGVERMRTIMSGLRLFISAPDEIRSLVDVRSVIESALTLVGPQVEHKARVERKLAEVPLMRGNPGQLGQMIVNLITNAADSIEAGDPGAHRIIVETSTSEKGEIVVEISDTGCGMSDDVRKVAFDPFFTTKPPGVGTGLGLSICHGIVSSHGGTIGIEAAAGEGTVLRVIFPAASADTGSSTHEESSRERRLLIIEDNEHVGGALAEILKVDYDATLVVGNGHDAMALLDQPRPAFETILCDVHLGATTGKQIYDRLAVSHPELVSRIVFMTGAALSAPLRHFLNECPNPCLMKPFNRTEFREAVEELRAKRRKPSGTQLKAGTLPTGTSEGKPNRGQR
jgi:signal transduction histidine kinase